MSFKKIEISDGITLLNVKAGHFKTNEISVSLAVPLKSDTASANALLIGLLSRKSGAYPKMIDLNRKLASLYGASLQPYVDKNGECQVLTLLISCLDDRFSLDKKSISLECTELLMSMLFEPNLDENGTFLAEDIEAEKRVLIEKIESEENEKRTYVLRQTEKTMFKNEPYGINRYGTISQVKSLNSDDILSAWKNLLSKAKIMINVVGDTDIEKVKTLIENKFSSIERKYEKLPQSVFIPKADSVKNELERIDVKQGKLVLGFRVNLKPDDKLTPAMRTFCDVFGGGPYSKLFMNVREKMSLCYYCSARYTRLKSCILVQCGCNEENMDKAVNEILNQLNEIKNGNCKEEFESSKMAINDIISSVNDSPEMLDNWYSNQITESVIKSPEMSADENNSVTLEQIKECASLITLDTVYKLTALKGEE
ncbi:MAG: insulinase family protein [Clostridiales bacterium]|nr:insulinase family protein [Clostridiales bacterium]